MDGRPTDAAPVMLPYRLPATADDSAHGQVASNHACEAVLSLAALEHNSTPPHTMRAHNDLNADLQAESRDQQAESRDRYARDANGGVASRLVVERASALKSSTTTVDARENHPARSSRALTFGATEQHPRKAYARGRTGVACST